MPRQRKPVHQQLAVAAKAERSTVGSPVQHTVGLFWGPLAELEALLAPVEQIQAADARTVASKSFWAAREFLSATTPLGTYAVKSGFVRGSMAPAGITTMLEWITMMPGVPSREQEGPTVLYGWGGKGQ